MHKITKILSAISLSLIYSIGAVSALEGVRDSKAVEAADEVSTKTIYALSKEKELYAYRWTDGGGSDTWNSEPQMTYVETFDSYNLFKVDTTYDNVLFRNEAKERQTWNITNLDGTKVYLIESFPTESNADYKEYSLESVTTNRTFKLLGGFNEWNKADNTVVFNSTNWNEETKEYQVFNVDLPACKVKSVMVDLKAAVDDSVMIWLESNDISIEAGRYNIYFSPTWKKAWEDNQGYLWFEKVDVYTLDLVRGSEAIESGITTTKNTENSNEFYTTTAFDVKAGDKLVVKVNGTESSDFSAKVNGNNNYIENKTFMFDMSYGVDDGSARIYLDTSAKTVFAGGLEWGKYGVVVNNVFHNLKQDTSEDAPTNQYILENDTSLSLTKDSVVTFAHTLNAESVGFPTIFTVSLENGGASNYFEVTTSGLKVKDDVEVNVYFKLSSGADSVYFEYADADLFSAISFARGFNSTFAEGAGVCVADGSSDVATIKSNWEAKKTAYTSLSETAKNYIKDEYKDTYTDIGNMLARYDYIYGKYSSELGADNNFLSRTPINTGSARSLNLTSDNSVTFIAIIVVASITLIAASSYIVVKKSKRQ